MPAGRIVLITGGNRGLGFETARRLHDAGQTMYIGVRDTERGRAAADELGVALVRLDVTDEGSVAAAADELERREGHLDVLVNNAGIAGTWKEAAGITGADASEVFETNVSGIVRVTHAFLPLLEKSASPVIVNVSKRDGIVRGGQRRVAGRVAGATTALLGLQGGGNDAHGPVRQAIAGYAHQRRRPRLHRDRVQCI